MKEHHSMAWHERPHILKMAPSTSEGGVSTPYMKEQAMRRSAEEEVKPGHETTAPGLYCAMGTKSKSLPTPRMKTPGELGSRRAAAHMCHTTTRQRAISTWSLLR